MLYEKVYVVFRYSCGHSMCRAMFRDRVYSRKRKLDRHCPNCTAQPRERHVNLPESFGISTEWPPVAGEMAV